MALDIAIKPGMFQDLTVELTRPGNDNFYHDISDIVAEINLYEKLNFGLISGNALIADENNVLDMVAMTGDEQIKMSLIVDDEETNILCDVTSIDNRKASGQQGKETWMINFQSFMVRASVLNTVNHAFNDILPEAIVENIINDHSPVPADYDSHTSNNILSCVIPNWPLMKAIQWVATHTTTEGNNKQADFLYYETFGGYLPISNFKSLSQLLSADPYIHLTKPLEPPRTLVDKIKTIELFEHDPTSVNAVQNQAAGMYASTLHHFDFRTKTLSTEEFNHKDNWVEKDHANPHIPYADTPADFDEVPKTEKYNSNIKLIAAASNNFKVAQERNWDTKTTRQGRNALLADMKNNKVKIIIPGNMNMHVGMTIMVTIPSTSVGRIESSDNGVDENASGKYLITTLRHSFAGETVKTIIGCIKDGSTSKII